MSVLAAAARCTSRVSPQKGVTPAVCRGRDGSGVFATILQRSRAAAAMIGRPVGGGAVGVWNGLGSSMPDAYCVVLSERKGRERATSLRWGRGRLRQVRIAAFADWDLACGRAAAVAGCGLVSAVWRYGFCR